MFLSAGQCRSHIADQGDVGHGHRDDVVMNTGDLRARFDSRLPASECAVDAGVVNLWNTLRVLFDRQFFPLTSRVEHAQDVVEDRVGTPFGFWAPAT